MYEVLKVNLIVAEIIENVYYLFNYGNDRNNGDKTITRFQFDILHPKSLKSHLNDEK